MNDPRGSKWRKWDLHVHTPLSLVQEYGGDTNEAWEKYIKALELLPSDIKVLGINDYLFIDGYKKVLDYKNSGRLENIDLILPVIELRLDKLVGSSQLNRINFHVIFANAEILSPEIINAQFINGLSGAVRLDPEADGIDWSGIINPDSLADLGQKVWDGTPENKRTSDSMLRVGFNNISSSFKEIEKLLASSYLKDVHIKAIGKVEWEDFRWEGSQADKKTIANTADVMFTASPTVEKANQGLQSLITNNVKHRLLHSSDAHKIATDLNNTSPNELGHCFTWIKTDTTFEGLKQVLYDYEDRVKIQAKNPYEDNIKYVLNEIIFKEGNAVKSQTIKLNRDLVSIIGSKGSGKSFLLSSLSPLSDLGGYAKNMHEIFKEGENNQKVFTKLVDKDGNEIKKDNIELSVVDNENATEPILYIKQEELAGRSKRPGEVRQEYLEELGIGDLSIGYQDIIDDVSYNLVQIDEKQEELSDIAKNLDVNESSKIDEFLDKKIIGLEEINKKLSNDTTRSIIESISKILAEGQNMNLWMKDDGFKEIELLIESVNEKIGSFNEKMESFGAKKSLSSINIDGFRKEYLVAQEEVKIILESKRNEYRAKQDELKKLDVSEDIPTLLKTIENIQKDRVLYKNVKDQLEKIKKAIPEKRQYIASLFDENGIVTIRIHERVTEINDKFTEFKNQRKGSIIFEELFTSIGVAAKVFFDYKKLRKDIIECFYTGKAPNIDQEIFGSDKPSYEGYLKWIHSSFWDFVDGCNADLMQRIAGQKLNGFERLLEVILVNWHRYVSVSVQITHKFGDVDKEIDSMSAGELATVLLKLILVTRGLDKQIILLDQPEDHLDNDFIAKDLVNLLRKLKKLRQVIMVTHNANLVIGTDSEQVIVANGLREDYICGGIENPDIKEQIIKILEGGADAFRQRSKRYNVIK